MPDVIIKGMEMPGSCNDCPLFHAQRNQYDESYCKAHGRLHATRKKGCPLRPAGSWISVEERLPERYKIVLTAAKGDRVRENFLTSEYRKEWSYDGCGVHHWMPLPEPPE